MEETLQLVQVEPGQIRIGDNGYFRKFIGGYQRLSVRRINKKGDKVYIDAYLSTYKRWKSLTNPISISEVYKYS
tara:strand:- start:1465 stop:1686 length:222 start_codon:yes stop_codon:yes gene_type:complete